MKAHYVKAIAVGAAIGIFIMACTACSPGSPIQFIPFNDTVRIPFWDYKRFFAERDSTVGLQYAAVGLRFCMLFLESGFSFLFPPIALSCLFARLSEVKTPYSELVCLRRALKSTGIFLLLAYVCLWVIQLFIGGNAQPGFGRPDLYVVGFFVGIWEGFKYSVAYGIVFVVLLLSFIMQMNSMADEPIGQTH